MACGYILNKGSNGNLLRCRPATDVSEDLRFIYRSPVRFNDNHVMLLLVCRMRASLEVLGHIASERSTVT
jgi:hypothetical protein